ncbi:MAG: MFS transporter [Dehalococcoidales bacterium]|nr:MFS transporter [Dehalococcoidales bacterium]
MPGKSGKFFYGWYIVAAGSIVAGLNSFLYVYGFTSFVDPVISTFGWAYGQVALAITIRSIANGVLNPVFGAMVDRTSARKLMLIGSAVVGLGYFILSQTSNIVMFYTGYLVIGLGGSVAISLVPQTTMARWFQKNLGKASGINGFFVALGGVAAPLLVLSIETFGWQDTFLYAAILTWALMLPLSLVFRNRPEEYGLLPDGEVPDENRPQQQNTKPTGLTIKQAMRTRTFWIIGIGTFLQVGGSFTILVNIMPHLVDIGMDREYASLVVMTIAIVGMVVRIPMGWVMDVINRRNVIAISIALHGLSLFLIWLIQADSPFILIVAFAIPFGIGNGSIWVRATLNREYFGVKHFGTITGVMGVFMIAASSIFPTVAGTVFDTTGDYRPVFLAIGILCLAGAGLTLLIPKTPAPFPE